MTWQKDGRTLSQLPRYHFAPHGNLIIKNITSADTGRYECNVKNEHGRTTAAGFVTVK